MLSGECVFCGDRVDWGVQTEHVKACALKLRAEVAELRSKFSLSGDQPNYQSRLRLRQEIIQLRDQLVAGAFPRLAEQVRGIIVAARATAQPGTDLAKAIEAMDNAVIS